MYPVQRTRIGKNTLTCFNLQVLGCNSTSILTMKVGLQDNTQIHSAVKCLQCNQIAVLRVEGSHLLSFDHMCKYIHAVWSVLSSYIILLVSALMVFGDTSLDSLATESICHAAKQPDYPVRKHEQQDMLSYFVKGCEMLTALATSFGKSLCIACSPHINLPSLSC